MSLESVFEEPRRDCGPVPWWEWNGNLEPERLERQIHLMYDQGIREFFVYAERGLVPEFLGNDYLNALGRALGWCRDLGMKAWIYDDYTWPSGTAGGLVPRNHPDAVGWFVRIEKCSVEEARELTGGGSILHAVAVSPDGAVRPVADSSSTPGNADAFCYRLEKDKSVNLTVRGSLWTKRDPGMLDILSESACDGFIEEAYERIARRFPDEIGKTIPGFFTDEPQFAPGPLWDESVPWTPSFAQQFRDRYGYDIIPKLHDLNLDTHSSERTRVDYWSLVSELASSSFTGRLADWCEKHGMALTGHMVAEEKAIWSVHSQGDIPSHQLVMQVPGCDLLEKSTNYDPGGWFYDGLNTLRTPKLVASAARLIGRRRVLCEAFGVLPWSRAIADEKHVTDWLVALGVNMFNDNTLVSDISGFRKRCCSGKHFTQPWWRYAKVSYDYITRASAMSADTVLDTELAVLYPSTSWWALARVGKDEPERLTRSENAFNATLEALTRRHRHFEFLFEPILERAQIRNGAVVCDHATFRAVVLAGVDRLPPAAARRLEEFAASGGCVVLVECETESMEPGGNRPISLRNAVRLSSVSDDGFTDALADALENRAGQHWWIDGPGSHGVISAARIDENGRRFLFVANMTPGPKSDLVIRWNDDYRIEMWDGSDGRRWKPAQTPGQCRLDLPDSEAVWIVESRGTCETSAPPVHFARASDWQHVLELGGPYAFRAEPANLCRLDCKLKRDLDGTLTFESLSADDGSWLDLDLGKADVSLSPDEIEGYWLYAEFTLDEQVPDLQLIVDSTDSEQAFLNGRVLGDSYEFCVWDESNRAWDIGPLAVPGTNRVFVRVKASPYYAQAVAEGSTDPTISEPVVLRGTFGARENGRWPALSRPPSTIGIGDWRKQGFPHFAGTGVYETRFRWNGPERPAVFLCEAGRGVVEVELDGLPLGVRAWGHRYFVTDRISAGEHRLAIRVTNTLGDLLRRGYVAFGVSPEVPPSGLASPVKVALISEHDRSPQ